MTAIAANCIDDLVQRMRKINGLEEHNVRAVYSEEDAESITKGMIFPFVGVVYGSMRKNGAGHKAAQSVTITCSLMLFVKHDARSRDGAKAEHIITLDTLRSAVFDWQNAASPSGHKWEFEFEGPMEGKKGVLVYLQRWSTAAQLR